MDFDFSKLAELEFTPEEAAELNGPYQAKHAAEAVRLGVAQAISDAGMTPSEFQELLKVAEGGTGFNPMSAVKDYAGLIIGGGALLGAGTGYLRHKAEQAAAGTDDPEVTSLRKRIALYRTMNGDLRTGIAARPMLAA